MREGKKKELDELHSGKPWQASWNGRSWTVRVRRLVFGCVGVRGR